MFELAQNTAAMESARAFRLILDAMAKPGTPMSFVETTDAPDPLWSGTDQVIKTLCDFQSPLWFSGLLSKDDIVRHVKFHTGAPITRSSLEAAFAVMAASEVPLPLSSFNLGSHEYPDCSTTLLIQVSEFNNTDVELSGPGLKAPIGFGVTELGKIFWTEMISNHQLYPLGVDVIFISRIAIACCPRSTHITLKESG